MKRSGWGLSIVLLVATSALCCITGVRASDVEQACRKDAECVVVEELEQIDGRCTVPCHKAAIHRRALERYNAELALERGDCRTITHLVCDPEQFVPQCKFGKCVAVTEEELDAGVAARW